MESKLTLKDLYEELAAHIDWKNKTVMQNEYISHEYMLIALVFDAQTEDCKKRVEDIRRWIKRYYVEPICGFDCAKLSERPVPEHYEWVKRWRDQELPKL